MRSIGIVLNTAGIVISSFGLGIAIGYHQGSYILIHIGFIALNLLLLKKNIESNENAAN